MPDSLEHEIKRHNELLQQILDKGGLGVVLVGLIKEEKQKAEIEALNHALEYMGQFPDFNLANMYEYIRDKE